MGPPSTWASRGRGWGRVGESVQGVALRREGRKSQEVDVSVPGLAGPDIDQQMDTMFAAPEVVGRQRYGRPVDCWAIGVIMYIL